MPWNGDVGNSARVEPMHATCCPECFHTMYLPDESFFGLKGKCPECGHKFALYPLGAENTDVQERPKDLAPESSPAKNSPTNAASSEAQDWPPVFEETLDQHPPAAVNSDDDSVNFDSWDGEEGTLSGPNPFRLEQVESRNPGPRAEIFEDKEPDDEFSVSGVWSDPDAPAKEPAPPGPTNRLPRDENAFTDPQFTWTDEADQSTIPDNGAAQSPGRTNNDPKSLASITSLKIRCPHCGGDVDCPPEELEKILRLSSPMGRAGRVWRWCRRRPLAAALIAIGVASLLFGAVYSAYFASGGWGAI